MTSKPRLTLRDAVAVARERIARVDELKTELVAKNEQLAAKDAEILALRAQLRARGPARTTPARIAPIRKAG